MVSTAPTNGINQGKKLHHAYGNYFFLPLHHIFYFSLSVCVRVCLWSWAGYVAQELSGHSTCTIFQGSWVPFLMGSCAFSSPVTFGGSMWVPTLAMRSKGTLMFQHRSDQNRGRFHLSRWKIVTIPPCGLLAQWLEYLHGLSPDRVMCIWLSCDIVCVCGGGGVTGLDGGNNPQIQAFNTYLQHFFPFFFLQACYRALSIAILSFWTCFFFF